MAQFTVHRNKNARTKITYPLLVDVQADLLNELKTCVVIPLTKVAALTRKPMNRLTPPIDVDGEMYLLMTPQLAGIARSDLGAAVASIEEQRSTIVAALDILIRGD